MNSVAGVIGTNHKSPMRPGRRHLLPPFLFSRFVHYYLGMPLKPVYDRALLLLGPKRNKVLTLEEVRQYGVDSFSDPDYVKIYGMAPAAWYRQGIRLLGRTAVECTRDALGNRIARDIGSYGDVYDATFGDKGGLGLPRGMNNLYSKGGLQTMPTWH